MHWHAFKHGGAALPKRQTASSAHSVNAAGGKIIAETASQSQ
jgi:hypothetical protein